MKWPAALAIVRARVKPARDEHSKRREREEWWKFSRSVPALFAAVEPFERFVACPATAKRFHMIWCAKDWVPSNAVTVFAVEDDFAFGVLSSHIHTRWATDQSTKLETRPRYTTHSFMSFPWPHENSAEVARFACSYEALRGAICVEQTIGLTTLYNQMDDGAWKDLRDLHRELDEAVAVAYGWPKSVAHDPDESNRRLLELNRAIAAGEVEYDPFHEG